jgi:hypothetical protein
VDIAKDYRLDGPGSFPGRAKIFLFSVAFRPVHLASYPMGIGGSFLEVKRQGRKANYSPPSSAEVKNGGVIPPLPRMSSWHSA